QRATLAENEIHTLKDQLEKTKSLTESNNNNNNINSTHHGANNNNISNTNNNLTTSTTTTTASSNTCETGSNVVESSESSTDRDKNSYSDRKTPLEEILHSKDMEVR
ncbi:unnamed protein product, partial [Meganyctiphanes norvegica]